MPSHPLDEYGNVQKASMSGRELEAAVLTRAAQKLKECQDNWDSQNMTKLDEALKYNQMVWSIFQAELTNEENDLPQNIKQDLLSLSIFVDRRIFDIMAYPTPEKLESVININLNIAAGLRRSPESS